MNGQGTGVARARAVDSQDLLADPGEVEVRLRTLSIPLRDDIVWARRAIEFLLAALLLVATLPVMLIIAVIIKLDSRGPALFVQKRLGKGARQFAFVKFRTMHVDARQRFPELYAYAYSPEQLDNLCFKVPVDPRITRVGAWLRKSTLDELPNLWNILAGHMNLIGPRPEIPEMLQYYQADMLEKFSIKPGVTGLAQISGRGRLRFFDTVNFDVEYVHRRSPRLDAIILMRTIKGVCSIDGAF